MLSASSNCSLTLLTMLNATRLPARGYVPRGFLRLPPFATSAALRKTSVCLLISTGFERTNFKTHKEQPAPCWSPLLSFRLPKARLFSTVWDSPLIMIPPLLQTTFSFIVPPRPTRGGCPSKRRPYLGLEWTQLFLHRAFVCAPIWNWIPDPSCCRIPQHWWWIWLSLITGFRPESEQMTKG